MGGIDRISQLPDDVLHSILSLLPLRKAAATAALSKRWRHVFPTVPDLNFSHIHRSPNGNLTSSEKAFFQIVLDILDHRRGPVTTFQIQFSFANDKSPNAADSLDRITRSLCDLGIKDLTLSAFHQTRCFLVPSHVLSCSTLKRLALMNCTVTIPPKFIGLPNLGSLELLSVHITSAEIERIVSLCHALQDLKLHLCYGLDNLVIRSKSLSVLELATNRSLDISVQEAPRLSSACIIWDSVYVGDDRREQSSTLAARLDMLLEGMVHVENLTLHLKFLYKCNLPVPKRLASGCHLFRVKQLFFSMNPDDHVFLSILSCLLISSPNLQQLFIYGYKVGPPFTTKPKSWDQNEHFEAAAKWPAATTLHIDNLKHWVAFIKFLVMKASTLKKLTIVCRCRSFVKMTSNERSAFEKIRKELLLLQQASPHIVLELTVREKRF